MKNVDLRSKKVHSGFKCCVFQRFSKSFLILEIIKIKLKLCTSFVFSFLFVHVKTVLERLNFLLIEKERLFANHFYDIRQFWLVEVPVRTQASKGAELLPQKWLACHTTIINQLSNILVVHWYKNRIILIFGTVCGTNSNAIAPTFYFIVCSFMCFSTKAVLISIIYNVQIILI